MSAAAADPPAPQPRGARPRQHPRAALPPRRAHPHAEGAGRHRPAPFARLRTGAGPRQGEPARGGSAGAAPVRADRSARVRGRCRCGGATGTCPDGAPSAAMTANERSFWKPYTSGMASPPVLLDAARRDVFREVVQRGSLSAAAEALSFTQPAVSRQVAALEREAGAQLLERTARGIRLTEAGRVLLAHAEAILRRMAPARAHVASVAGLAAGRLRIGAFQTANAAIVPRAIAEFARTYPRVELSLVEAITPAAIAHLRAGDVDVAVVT